MDLRYEKHNLKEWSTNDAIDWLSKDKNFVKYCDIFKTQNVNGQTIVYSFENKSLKEDLKDIGITALGYRNKILQFVEERLKAEKDNQSLVTGTKRKLNDKQELITGFLPKVSKKDALHQHGLQSVSIVPPKIFGKRPVFVK